VLIGVGLVWATGLVWLDPIVAMLAGLNIVWTAVGLMRQSYGGLMERVDPEETARVLAALAEAEATGRVEGYHHVRHRRVNDQLWIELHLLLPDELRLDEAHRRATDVENRIRALFPRDRVLVTSHLEPASHEHPVEAAHDALADSLSGRG
jgi:cation diffusion facilitator family transporter